jgi:putative ABC transport system substrate-binding protein
MIKRREFIAGLGGAAAAWPLAAHGQQPAMPVIGFLDLSSPIGGLVAAFRQDLKEAGYIEGQNVAIEFRWANNNFNVLPDLAADLVRRRVAVIVASGVTPVAVAARDATSTIPIVFSGGADPVKYGLVASLSHPGGNITGVTSLYNEVAGKRLDMLSKLVPHPKTFGYLVGYQNDYETNLTNDLLGAARTLGLEVIVLQCLRDSDIEAAFTLLAQRQVSGVVVSAFAAAFNSRPKILALAARHKIPAIYVQSQYAYEGGLMSYSAVAIFRQVGFYYVPQIQCSICDGVPGSAMMKALHSGATVHGGQPNLAFTVQEEGLGVPRIAPLRDRRLVKQSSGADWPTR